HTHTHTHTYILMNTHRDRPLSNCCGPYCFLSVHLSHLLSLAAGQTAVSECRGPVVTVVIKRPELCNAANKEAAKLRLNLLFFHILIIFPSSLTFQRLYFVILWSPPGGNFCAGYDLTELANHTASLKLEQDVTKGPRLMVSAVLCLSKPLKAAVRTPLIDGGPVRLPRVVGLSRTLVLILTGLPIGTQEALYSSTGCEHYGHFFLKCSHRGTVPEKRGSDLPQHRLKDLERAASAEQHVF
uniref:Uncharacterized protein n=1 Tax=Scophthalmus maximus TaxID=52904 RepID=A0A8D3BDE5_SCOMX